MIQCTVHTCTHIQTHTDGSLWFSAKPITVPRHKETHTHDCDSLHSLYHHTHTHLTVTQYTVYTSTYTYTHILLSLTQCTVHTSTSTYTHPTVTQCVACTRMHTHTPVTQHTACTSTHTPTYTCDSMRSIYQQTHTHPSLWLNGHPIAAHTNTPLTVTQYTAYNSVQTHTHTRHCDSMHYL